MLTFTTPDKRTLGSLGISIATDLAIMGALGEHPDNPTEINEFKNIEYAYINISTLCRNVYNAIPTADRQYVGKSMIREHVMEDMELIRSLFEAKIFVKPIFYINRYFGISGRWPNTLFKKLKTDKQRKYHEILTYVLSNVEENEDIIKFNLKMKGKDGNSLMLTHMPTDLLWHKDFTNLKLWESHTGKVKPRELWYTKFTDPEVPDTIPFNPVTVKIFGDGNNMIQQMPHDIREKIITISRKRKWTWMTSVDRVVENIKLEKDPKLDFFINSLVIL